MFNKAQFGSAVRFLLTSAGAVCVSRGWFPSEVADYLVGGSAMFGAFAWSMVRHYAPSLASEA